MPKFFANKKNIVFSTMLVVIISAFGFYSFAWQPQPEVVEAEMLSDNYYTFTPEKYSQVQSEADAVLLNFYADWCATCNSLEPEIIDTFSELGVRHNVYGVRVNFGDNSEVPEGSELAAKYGVKSYTSYVVLTGQGEIYQSYYGSIDRETLRDALINAASVSQLADAS